MSFIRTGLGAVHPPYRFVAIKWPRPLGARPPTSAISKSGNRFCVRSRFLIIERAHDLFAKPRALWRTMRYSKAAAYVGSPPAQGVFGDIGFFGGHHRRARGASAGQF